MLPRPNPSLSTRISMACERVRRNRTRKMHVTAGEVYIAHLSSTTELAESVPAI
jgi:hypothetical protein